MQQIDKDIAFSDFYERNAGSMQGYMSTCIPTLKNTESSPSSQFNFDVQTPYTWRWSVSMVELPLAVDDGITAGGINVVSEVGLDDKYKKKVAVGVSRCR